jgi:hypothetical protein
MRMYCIEGRRKDGRTAWIGSDQASGGWHYFAERAWDAMFLYTASSAKGVLGGVPKMGTYFNGSHMDIASFKVHEVSLETKPVARVSDDMRAALSRTDSRPPIGWRFLITDADGKRYAAPERFWTPTTSSLNEAFRTPSLADAVKALDHMEGDGWRLMIARVQVNPAPVQEQELDDRITREKAERTEAEKDADLSDTDVYRPTF